MDSHDKTCRLLASTLEHFPMCDMFGELVQ
jgi:hypothetical protein